MTFDPAFFIYLNPEIDVTVEDAFNVYNNMLAAGCNVYASVDIPKDFNETIYIADNKDTIDISHLNALMKTDPSGPFMFLPSIYKDVNIISNNTFQLDACISCNSNAYNFSSNVISVGDTVRIIKNTHQTFEATVISTNYNTNVVTVQGTKTFLSTESNAYYLFYGIKLYDVRRLAYVNYSRALPEECSCIPFIGLSNPDCFDSMFNPNLYRVLYPNAYTFDDKTAFVDYRSRHENGDMRISTVKQLANTEDMVIGSLSMRDTSNITTYNKVCYISKDWVTPSALVSECDNAIMTELTVKKFVESGNFPGDVSIQGDLFVYGTSTLCNVNAPFAQFGNVSMSNLSVAGGAHFYDIWVDHVADITRLDAGTANMSVAVVDNVLHANRVHIGCVYNVNDVLSPAYTDERLVANSSNANINDIRLRLAQLSMKNITYVDGSSGIGLLADEVFNILPEIVSVKPSYTYYTSNIYISSNVVDVGTNNINVYDSIIANNVRAQIITELSGSLYQLDTYFADPQSNCFVVLNDVKYIDYGKLAMLSLAIHQ